MPPQTGSPLSLSTLRLEAGGSVAVGDAGQDTLLFVFDGSGSLELDGGSHALAHGSAGLVVRGEQATLTAGDGALEAVRMLVGTETDQHAPMGDREVVVALDDAETGAATGSRTFQVLFGPHNGSILATLFVGYIPPGAAKLHYHLYDEIVWIFDGVGRLHVGGELHDLSAGSAFRLTPRERHIVENVHERNALVVLGLFTPAGSPSAAYLPS